MPSSPVAYPSSSPRSPPLPVKRPLPAKDTAFCKPKTVGGFLLDDDSEDDLPRDEPARKRRMLSTERDNFAEVLEAKKSPAPANPKAKTVGGFLIDDDEDEDMDIDEPTLPPLPQEPKTTMLFSISEPEVTKKTDAFVLPDFLNRPETPSAANAGNVTGREMLTCSGTSIRIKQRKKAPPVSFEQMVAARSSVKTGRARKSYYGIDIHQLIDDAGKQTEEEKLQKTKVPEDVLPSVEPINGKPKSRKTLMWSEKYRARNFMELVGDDRTHRQVLRWLKAWDPIVFPKAGKAKPTASKRPGEQDDEKAHRKILLLTGPPGLGKTTLAHVCARQAGYEVMEINASDERSSNVVKGRIRTSVGTESVKTGSTVTLKNGHVQKVANPLCVVVDEVDGVVGGSGGSGEGGFIKALIDLILLDQKNTSAAGTNPNHSRKKKKDDFKLMRPLILICNDVYHPSLRPLRQSSFAEIIHVRKPPMDAVVTRLKSVFEKEGVPCDTDAVRRLCEATWGVSAAESRKGREGAGEGDLRGILVVGEWAAGKLRATSKKGTAKLTRKWVEQNMMSDLGHGGGGARGVGRGGTKEVVNRVFLEGAGFPKTVTTVPAPDFTDSNNAPKSNLGVAELAKKAGIDRLREMVDTSGDIDRIVTDIFADYPNQPFNDDSLLTKPDTAYEWLHFHDTCSTQVFTNQAFELSPYLSQPILACHNLFSSSARHNFGRSDGPKKWDQEEEEEEPLPFSGPRADYEAFEAQKSSMATILTLQSNLNADLLRGFRSPEDIATDLLPYLVRMLTPEIKPIVVGGSGDQRGIASVRKESEKAMVRKAADVMGGVGVIFERGKLEGDFGSRNTQWVYRMEP